MSTPDPRWLGALLQDTKVTDICINGGSAFADSGRGLEPVPDSGWAPEPLKAWVLEQISLAGRSWDARHPFIDAPVRGTHRLHAAFPPVARGGILVSLRRLPGQSAHSPEAARAAARTRWDSDSCELLAAAVRAGDSVLIAGATGSGKTTLAGDLLAEVPAHERLIALEDTPELAPAHPHFVTLLSRAANADGFGEVTLRALLRQVLRMRPDRVILGECRGGEVLELLQALNTGHQGALATLHANSPRDALRRMELLCLIAAGAAIPVPVIRELIASGIRWVVHVRRHGERREISEIARLEGREGDTLLLRTLRASPPASSAFQLRNS